MVATELIEPLRALGVRPGGVLLVHTSFRAVSPVRGGPLGLIGALRAAVGRDGTLVMRSRRAFAKAGFTEIRTVGESCVRVVVRRTR